MEQELVYHDSEERKRILDNTYINAMVFHNEMCREWMREIQGVYIVTKTNEPPDQSVNKEIHLMWDHDRLWGLFCFRAFKGVFLVDPGPGQEIFKDVDELFAPQYLVPTDKGLQEPQKQREYRLVWRGRNRYMERTLFNSPWTIGAMCFWHRQIKGVFSGMDSARITGGECKFLATRSSVGDIPRGSLSGAINLWNSYRICNRKERLQTGGDAKDQADRAFGELFERTNDAVIMEERLKKCLVEMLLKEKRRWWKELLSFVPGAFVATNTLTATEETHELLIQFLVPDDQETIWGEFNIGESKGFLRLDFPPLEDLSKIGRKLEFNYRAKHCQEEDGFEGTCCVTFNLDGTIECVFHPSVNGVSFKGEPKSVAEEPSLERNSVCFRGGWDGYRPGLSIYRKFRERNSEAD